MMSTPADRLQTKTRRGALTNSRLRIGFPYAGLVLIVLCLIWEVATLGGYVSPIVLPQPTAVVADLVGHWHLFLVQSGMTLLEIVTGFALSVAIAVPLAVLLSTFRLMERMFYPIIVSSQTVPVVSIAPILLAWFGFGLLPKMIVVVLITFFPVMTNTFTGLRSMSEQTGNLARSMGASRFQLFWHFQLPGALPNIFSGLKIAVTLSVVGAVVAEFVGSDSGLGYEIMLAGSNLNLAHQFASVAVLSVMGLILYSIMTRVERLCLPWHVSMRPKRG